jgi:hypothetical protein
VTLWMKDVSAWEAVLHLATTAGLNVIVSEQAVLLTDLKELKRTAGPGVPGELAKTFDETPVSFEFTKMKLGDAMEFLRKVSPVRFARVIIGEKEREERRLKKDEEKGARAKEKAELKETKAKEEKPKK